MKLIKCLGSLNSGVARRQYCSNSLFFSAARRSCSFAVMSAEFSRSSLAIVFDAFLRPTKREMYVST